MMLVWDKGTSNGLTTFRSDFIYYVKCDITVKNMTKVNGFIGIVTTLHKLIGRNGQDILFPFISYQLTHTYVRIFSPQIYHQMHGGHSVVQGNQVTMYLPFNRIHIHVDHGGTNLPVLHNSFVTGHQNRSIGPQMRPSLDYSRISKLDIFCDTNTVWSLQAMDISINQMKTECEFKHRYSLFCGTCVGAPANTNLSGPQKELLL